MKKWLWVQKQRMDKGYQLIGLVNFALLLSQSSAIKGHFNVGGGIMLLIGVPAAVMLVWLCGYLLTVPSMQRAEDGAIHELTPSRRDTQEILRLLKEMQK